MHQCESAVLGRFGKERWQVMVTGRSCKSRDMRQWQCSLWFPCVAVCLGDGMVCWSGCGSGYGVVPAMRYMFISQAHSLYGYRVCAVYRAAFLLLFQPLSIGPRLLPHAACAPPLPPSSNLLLFLLHPHGFGFASSLHTVLSFGVSLCILLTTQFNATFPLIKGTAYASTSCGSHMCTTAVATAVGC